MESLTYNSCVKKHLGEGEGSEILSVTFPLVVTQVFKTFVKDELRKSGFFSDLDYGFRNFNLTVTLFTVLHKKSLTSYKKVGVN